MDQPIQSAPAFTFGRSIPTTAPAGCGGFSFGSTTASIPTTASIASTAPAGCGGFSFGSTTASIASTAPAGCVGFSFGASVTPAPTTASHTTPTTTVPVLIEGDYGYSIPRMFPSKNSVTKRKAHCICCGGLGFDTIFMNISGECPDCHKPLILFPLNMNGTDRRPGEPAEEPLVDPTAFTYVLEEEVGSDGTSVYCANVIADRFDAGVRVLTFFPVSFIQAMRELITLKWLLLDGNYLESLPNEIGQLLSLERLDICDNKLTTLPSGICELLNLKSLNVKHNMLTSLPTDVGKLKKIKELDVSWNNITYLPAGLWNLKSLKTLRLESNDLSSISVDIGKLVNLTELDVSRTCLSVLPNLSGLVSLKRLIVRYNSIDILSEEIGLLPNITYIDIRHNRLKEIPKFMLLGKCRPINIMLNNNEIPYGIQRIDSIRSTIDNSKRKRGRDNKNGYIEFKWDNY